MRASWEAGGRGVFCAHPAQAAAANRCLRPTQAEVVLCAEAVRAYTEAQRRGEPYGVRQGVIIDAAIARAALSTIAHSLDCAAKDAAKLLRRREMERAEAGETAEAGAEGRD